MSQNKNYSAAQQFGLQIVAIEPKENALTGNKGYYLRFKGLKKGTYIDAAVSDGGLDRLGNDHGAGRQLKVGDTVLVNQTDSGDFRLSSVSLADKKTEIATLAASSMAVFSARVMRAATTLAPAGQEVAEW